MWAVLHFEISINWRYVFEDNCHSQQMVARTRKSDAEKQNFRQMCQCKWLPVARYLQSYTMQTTNYIEKMMLIDISLVYLPACTVL